VNDWPKGSDCSSRSSRSIAALRLSSSFLPCGAGDMKEGVEPPEQLEQLDASGVKEVGR
jgi:hypothetical protein